MIRSGTTRVARRLDRSGARVSFRTFLVALCALSVIACSRAPRTAPDPVAQTGAEFFGWVYRVDGADTLPVDKAKVWTEPPSDAVSTKADGYWTISTGLVPGRYRVFAEYEGVTGRSSLRTAMLGRSDTVLVVIGANDTPWPPALAFVSKLPKGTLGPSSVR